MIVSPKDAAFIAACRSPPGGTTKVAALVGWQNRPRRIKSAADIGICASFVLEKAGQSRGVRQGKSIMILTSVIGRSLRACERLLNLRTRITTGVPFVGDYYNCYKEAKTPPGPCRYESVRENTCFRHR